MPALRYIEGVATLTLDQSRCNGCGLCAIVCPHAVFRLVHRKSEIVDHGACMECGACANNCEAQAIHVEAGVGCAIAIISNSLFGKKNSQGKVCCG